MILGDLPGPVATEGQAGEIQPLRVAVKFFDFGVKGRDGHAHDVGVGPVVMVVGVLRHDDDEGPSFRMGADGIGEADLGLVHAVGSAFAGAVQKEDHGPKLLRIPALRHVDLILVDGSVSNDGAIQKAGVLRAFCCVRGKGIEEERNQPEQC